MKVKQTTRSNLNRSDSTGQGLHSVRTRDPRSVCKKNKRNEDDGIWTVNIQSPIMKNLRSDVLSLGRTPSGFGDLSRVCVNGPLGYS